VRDAVNPGAKRTAPVKCRQASPHGKVNFLHEIAPVFHIQLVSNRKAIESGGVVGQDLLVKLVLASVCAFGTYAFFDPHALFSLEIR
jgi:hypothetical protein